MTGIFLRSIAISGAALVALVLGACGGGTTEGALVPARFISIGDAFSDVGQLGTKAKYTVNDDAIDTWLGQVLASYGTGTLTASATGGLGFAQGNARINMMPDAAGRTATLTITQQVDAALATGAIGANDVIFLNAGASDIVAEMMAVLAGAQTEAQMLARVKQEGKDYGAQVRRLVDAGAKHVVVMGVYNLGASPWARVIGQAATLSSASTIFNQAFVVSIVDLGNQVLYIDLAGYINVLILFPSAFGFTNTSDAVCTSVDPGPGIGTGANQVNSSLCTATTIVTGATYSAYIFADGLNFTPAVLQLYGANVFSRLTLRW